MVAKWLGEVLSHYFTLTIFGNLEVFFVSFFFVVSLLCNPNKIL